MMARWDQGTFWEKHAGGVMIGAIFAIVLIALALLLVFGSDDVKCHNAVTSDGKIVTWCEKETR